MFWYAHSDDSTESRPRAMYSKLDVAVVWQLLSDRGGRGLLDRCFRSSGLMLLSPRVGEMFPSSPCRCCGCCWVDAGMLDWWDCCCCGCGCASDSGDALGI